jgi:hypothetical protein
MSSAEWHEPLAHLSRPHVLKRDGKSTIDDALAPFGLDVTLPRSSAVNLSGGRVQSSPSDIRAAARE